MSLDEMTRVDLYLRIPGGFQNRRPSSRAVVPRFTVSKGHNRLGGIIIGRSARPDENRGERDELDGPAAEIGTHLDYAHRAR